MIDDLDRLPDKELIRLVREAASQWFGNRALEFLEELIRRAKQRRLGDRDND
jgi:hypothetical protein